MRFLTRLRGAHRSDPAERRGGHGGAIFNGGPSPFGTPDLTLVRSRVLFNRAEGGAPSEGGSDGQGVGGGVFNLGTFAVDPTTVIARNRASTSDDDIFP